MSEPPRLVSLDAFRGFAIAGMVLVNNPGDWAHLYSQLAHARWHGWTFTDWIFPFFLFIVGVSMTISLARRDAEPRSRRLATLLKRAAVIFAVGLALHLFPSFDFATVRIPGVLQRIALCVAVAAPIVLWCGWRGVLGGLLALMALYSVLMLAVPVPGADGIVAAGVLEPGRDVGAFVDRSVFGTAHLWRAARTWDPEGLVSTLPAVATLLFGVLTGRLLGSPLPGAEKTVWMLLAGLALLWLGAILDVVLMPINKSLWTPSYSVFTAGWALVVFAAFHWLIDVAPQPAVRRAAGIAFKPLAIYGMNALFIFALSGFVARILTLVKLPQTDGTTLTLKAWSYGPLQALPLPPEATSLLWAFGFNLAMFAVAWAMWKRRWFIRA